MKLNKRILSLILAVVMVLGMVPVATAADDAAATCTECGSVGGHTLGCSQFVIPTCEECHGDLLGEKAGHSTTCSQYVAPETTPASTSEEGTEGTTEGTTVATTVATTESTTEGTTAPSTEATTAPSTEPVVPEKTFAETLLEIDNLSDLLIAICDENNLDALLALTAEEITALRARANELYAAIENPTEQDGWDLDDFLATMEMLPNYRAENACPDCGVVGDHAEDCPWMQMAVMPASGTTNFNSTQSINGRDIEGTATWNLNGHTITFNGTFDIAEGDVLTINGPGTIKRDFNKGALFDITSSGRLIINGNVVIDGAKKNATKAAIWVNTSSVANGKENLTLNNVTIKDCYRNNDDSRGRGGAIEFGDEGTGTSVVSTITNSTIDNCRAIEGSAIMLTANTKGSVSIKNSTIKNCEATELSGRYGGTIRTQGSTNLKLRIESCTIDNNNSYLNGGGVYWNARGDNAGLTITGTAEHPTKITNNTAKNGGGVFISGSSISIEHTEISGNTATYGGGINMQPYDFKGTHTGPGSTLTLGNGAKILNNGDANTQYGGGVYMQIDSGSTTDHSDFKVIVNNGAVIQNNTAKNGGAFAITQTIGNADCCDETAHENRKYDAYVDINGGIISNNHASVDGGAFYISRSKYGAAGSGYDLKVSIAGGQITNNTATRNGGAIYLVDDASNAVVDVSGGEAKNNSAVDGGAVYISGGTYNMSGGTFSANTASNNGGAVYVTGGSANMSGGTMSSNRATKNGGALYVNGGSFNMSGGVIGGTDAEANTAVDGGAVYITGGDFTMISGKLLSNKASVNGGGAYVSGGNVVVGVSGCTGDGTNHTVTYTDLEHPLIMNNEAQDSGGGVALIGNGNMTMYCGEIITNKADNGGRGLNVYMESGTFHFWDGDIGALTNPELVIIGGTLKNHQLTEGNVHLNYYHCNDLDEFHGGGAESNATKIATASKGALFNLPDGEKYWTAPDGFRFFGWTFKGTEANELVRNKNQYKPLGSPIQAYDVYAEPFTDDEIHMYALWAPEVSSITYVGSVINGIYVADTLNATNDATYRFDTSAYEIELNSPSKPGYEFKGWYYYQNEGQNANWGIEPDYKDGTSEKTYSNLNYESDTMGFLPVEESGDNAGKCVLNVEATNFGDLTMIAKFEQLEATINYVVEGPEGCGTVNPTSETVPMATGTVNGSVAEATNSNYRFVGWYDEEGKQVGTDAHYIPSKNDGLWESATYTAKFEWNLTTMKITKTVSGDIYDADDTFRFVVKDKTGAAIANVTLKHGQSVVIKDVIVGDTYTVVELTSSNRYKVDNAVKSITIAPPTAENEVSFVNTADEDKWLSATAVVKNTFGAQSFLNKLFGN